MNLRMAIARAGRGLREDLRLYLIAVSSLTVAFLCLATALLAIANVSRVADQWGRNRRMTIFLRDGASAADIDQLRVAVESLPEVQSVEHVTAAAARAQFLEQTDLDGELGALPPDAFPASLEVVAAGSVTVQRLDAVAERIRRFGAVEAVESYGGWFARLDSLLSAGRWLASVLALLVIVCVLAVVSNTIRLAVAGRREEIEVLKLCGASNGFVRRPFLVEGIAQGFTSALLSVLLLSGAYLVLQTRVDSTFASLAGVQAVFLHPLVIVTLLVGGAGVGAAGSSLALRRYLAV